MFCPDCGTDNSKGQKFCTRCGVNLLAIDRAREIVHEVSYSQPAPAVSSTLILVLVTLITLIGFAFTTGGVIYLIESNQGHTPMPALFGIGGFTTMILICRGLLKLLSSQAPAEPRPKPVVQYTPPAQVRGATNRSLNEPAAGYQSVIEDPTRQFEHERRS